MTFTSKKEADAYDKMLDIADNLIPFIQEADLGLDDATSEKLAFYFATRKDELTNLLKGGVQVKSTPAKKPAKKADTANS